MILALDYGEKRIGVAVSDDEERFGTVLDYIPNKSEVKKIFAKGFPKGTKPEEIQEVRRKEKKEASTEFRKLCNKLLYLINLYYPDKIIVGLPTTVDINGNPFVGAQAKKVQQFVKRLDICLKKNNIVLDIELIDESMTSALVEQKLKLKGMKSNNIREKIDSECARMLLEEYLSSKGTGVS
jgi:putative transcription antitermination factor YqgF